jgi:glutamyl/glutaminyl-tRNA synthetase
MGLKYDGILLVCCNLVSNLFAGMPLHICYKKTRIAPTPSGFLHLGNILSFAVTASLARKTGAKILLRIDDLDKARVNDRYIEDIFESLNFMGIPIDAGPRNSQGFESHYSQMHRMDMYMRALNKLADKNLVFACTCSRKQLNDARSCSCLYKQLPLSTKNACWRFITHANKQLTFKNYSGELICAFLPDEMCNFIVKKKDGLPAYQLTSIIDDIFYGIDLVVRGKDLWPSTLAQLELAAALDEDCFKEITFHHHPLLLGPSGNKLSKSAGDTSIKYLRESGKSAEDVYGIIADMLGINKKTVNWQQLSDAVIDGI